MMTGIICLAGMSSPGGAAGDRGERGNSPNSGKSETGGSPKAPGASGDKSFTLYPIGRVNRAGDRIFLEIKPELAPALDGLTGFSHLWVLYWFHGNDTPEERRTLKVHPRRDPANPLTGVFATRAPVRPNLIGMCACRLVKVSGNLVEVTGLDALQDSPILDLKPYIPGNDAIPEARAPAWVTKEKEPQPKPPGAGRSSFDLIDGARFFAEMSLQPGSTLLDLGCGPGFYTLAAADTIGPGGLIYAIDLWGEGIARLKEQAAARGYRQIRAVVADASQELPIKAGRVDVCLMATVLHDLVEAGTARGALTQVARVLKPGGTLAIVEFKKIEGPPGPPLKIRMTPAEVERLATPYGFRPMGPAVEVGPYNYLLRFVKEGK